ncbi:class I SAM-dependent methyltransferase [bacterium]|nr:class I SAM-dependent methyltransferase [bacterium]
MWDERYDTDEYVYGIHPNKFLVSIADRIPVGKTLCLGEGEGRNAVYLASLGHDVLAVDSSAVGLKKARRLAQQQGVEIKTTVANLADLEIQPNSWDAIISIFCHLPESMRKELHQKVSAGLRSGGMYVLEAFTPEQLKYKTGGPLSADLLYNLSDLTEELSTLEYDHSLELERDVLEGMFHTGRAAVVQVIAFKP